MTEHFPITPLRRSLVQQWSDIALAASGMFEVKMQFATLAAQWGSDQELEACCEWVAEESPFGSEELRAARRPKPPSLKEQALQELVKVDMLWATEEFGQETLNSLNTIREALEALPDD